MNLFIPNPFGSTYMCPVVSWWAWRAWRQVRLESWYNTCQWLWIMVWRAFETSVLRFLWCFKIVNLNIICDPFDRFVRFILFVLIDGYGLDGLEGSGCLVVVRGAVVTTFLLLELRRECQLNTKDERSKIIENTSNMTGTDSLEQSHEQLWGNHHCVVLRGALRWDRHTVRQTDRQTDRRTDRKTERQTDYR